MRRQNTKTGSSGKARSEDARRHDRPVAAPDSSPASVAKARETLTSWVEMPWVGGPGRGAARRRRADSGCQKAKR